MKKAILAEKVGMTQIWNDQGQLIPVTVLAAGPCDVLQVKTVENDGYEADAKKYVKEFKFENASEYVAGETVIKADIFAEGDKVDATAKSKGHGYAGGLKRHGLKSGPSGHGSKYHRHAGSNGSATTPGRVKKGKKMPGHMGDVQVTIQNLEIVKIDAENDIILVRGAVPGPKKSLVILTESVKAGK